jgi:hypothetical protein
MTDRAFAISIGDSQTIYATPDPQDQDQLTELFGDGPIQLREASGDVEGHALSSDVLVDVEGHAIALRLPTPADAAALRKALMVGAVTATLVAAGTIASLQNPVAPSSTVVVDTSRSAVTQEAPAQMVRADEAQQIREQGYADAQAAAQAAAIAESRGEVVTGEMKSEVMREQAGGSPQVSSQAAPSTVTNANPAGALHADQAEALREQAYANAQGSDATTASQAATADGDTAIPAPAQHADQAEQIREKAYNPGE